MAFPAGMNKKTESCRGIGFVLGKIIGGIALIFFLTNADVFFDSKGQLPIPSSVFFLICSGAILAAALICNRSIWTIWAIGIRQRDFILLPLLILALVTLFGSFSGDAYWGDGAKNVLLTFFDVWILFVSMLMGMHGWVRGSWKYLSGTALLILTSTIVWDLFHPGSFSNQLARGAGLGVNSNDAAFFVVFLTASTLGYARIRVIDVLILAVGTAGVFFTLSRGGIVLQVVLIVAYLGKAGFLPLLQGRKGAKRGIGVLLLIFVIVVGVFGAVIGSSPMFERDSAKKRVAILLGQENVLEKDEKRLRLIEDYVELIDDNPFFGNGAGFVSRQVKGPHNMFLHMWVEKGVLGLAAYVGWLVGCGYFFIRRSYFAGVVLVILALAESMFSHNLMDFRIFLIIMGVSIGLAGSQHLQQRKSSER